MNFKKLYDFLRDLQKNNHKDWMDANRNRYENVRDDFISWLDAMNLKLASLDPEYYDTPGKKAINRINNNLMFHPNKPTYKDHFGAGLDQEHKQGDFYIHLGVNGSFIGGGYWHPLAPFLKSIREAIDYNGEVLKGILDRKSFQDRFGNMIEGEALKKAPKGYSQDHRHIDLLRRKTFAVSWDVSEQEVISEGFDEEVLKVYVDMLPFRRYLNKAVSV